MFIFILGHFHDRARDHAASALDPAHHHAAGHVAAVADVPSRPAKADLNLKIVAHRADHAQDRHPDLAAGKLMVNIKQVVLQMPLQFLNKMTSSESHFYYFFNLFSLLLTHTYN